MCDFIEGNKCKVNNAICPWVYWCDKLQVWKPNKDMPKNCKIQTSVKHTGKYPVRSYRKGYLYVDINDITYKLENPFDFVPESIDVQKKNGVYKVKK